MKPRYWLSALAAASAMTLTGGLIKISHVQPGLLRVGLIYFTADRCVYVVNSRLFEPDRGICVARKHWSGDASRATMSAVRDKTKAPE